jgi:hypothetical protein
MTTSPRLKVVGPFTTIALPVADAMAGCNRCRR